MRGGKAARDYFCLFFFFFLRVLRLTSRHVMLPCYSLNIPTITFKSDSVIQAAPPLVPAGRRSLARLQAAVAPSAGPPPAMWNGAASNQTNFFAECFCVGAFVVAGPAWPTPAALQGRSPSPQPSVSPRPGGSSRGPEALCRGWSGGHHLKVEPGPTRATRR
jgi:hypothetical protein